MTRGIAKNEMTRGIAKSVKEDFPDRKLVDATKPLYVMVKPEDVRGSEPGKPRACALSWACYRENDIEEAIIYKSVAYLVYPKKIVRYLLNSGIQQEIVSFDRNKTFATGAYHLSPPGPANRLGAAQGKRRKDRPAETTPRQTRRRHKVVGVREYK